ncbi:MAG TPA: DNA repair protein RecN [Caldisericia bacterium]|nr:DNA repair protein RecN [Caldisericia bacterium]HPF49238.1 DNA repair protein RecN [Caldisericia bacterium]HPI84082.1 DNA repair protein RecN [Caldisericia bacterium]HPQ93340.1 DNA repair protein RecN [Caldisericia bacterium]HRV75278.1 DNA repair protein RecN [Caldisericia bacterium]
MLSGLSVLNYAIAKNITLDLAGGLTVITGETGAGKSILVGALLLGLGDKWQSDSIRPGEEKAIVELIFKLGDNQAKLLDDPTLVEDGELIVNRTISTTGKGRIRIGSVSSTLQALKGAVGKLVDVHSQFEAQSLLYPQTQVNLLDKYAGTEHEGILFEYQSRVKELKQTQDKLSNLLQKAAERDRRIDFITFELEEFERIKPGPDEDENLRQERNRLTNVQRLAELAGAAKVSLDGDEDFSGIMSLTSRATKALSDLKRIDGTQTEVLELFVTIEANAKEASVILADYLSELTFNPERLQEVEDRLAELEKLIRRHGSNLSDVRESIEKMKVELEELQNSDLMTSKLESQIGSLRVEIGDLGQRVREGRENYGKRLSELVALELADLALEKSMFEVKQTPIAPTENSFCLVNGEKHGYSENGIDSVEFMISTNPGMPPGPIAKIASGGELSRIMLALKVILASVDSVPTLVFDEVDSGVGGRVGEMIGRKLAKLSTDHQVICITHLPQIACYADTHLLINKNSEEDETTVSCFELARRGRIDELARMNSGDKVSQLSLKHAEEMLKTAEGIKRNQ